VPVWYVSRFEVLHATRLNRSGGGVCVRSGPRVCRHHNWGGIKERREDEGLSQLTAPCAVAVRVGIALATGVSRRASSSSSSGRCHLSF
jgi:hypothetical protein